MDSTFAASWKNDQRLVRFPRGHDDDLRLEIEGRERPFYVKPTVGGASLLQEASEVFVSGGAWLEVRRVYPTTAVLEAARRRAAERVYWKQKWGDVLVFQPTTAREVLELFSSAWNCFTVGGKSVCFPNGVVETNLLPYTVDVVEWERWAEQARVGRDIHAWYLGLWNPRFDETIFYEEDGNFTNLLLRQGALWLHVDYRC